ncbi:unsaturated rhamnogalacturonyl hydrolase [Evansella vedderi]|uniref:Unsaturated rhamnogalacturonyl hydrolase n=1 Tax=Evansella vedderi TaxID=38282 RepID=A0ABT9ZZB4_9BACI|nr:glycoside hydrolase family 88 protein [Evansella vedderi]MDQ0256581.1 unsaturated rhamnogalacturonyl hydrolase [Evansella vedderi]
MFIQLISVILLACIVLVLLLDIIPILKDWISRIHIGRFIDKSEWNRKITEIGVKWLNNTPKIKVTDNTRLVVLDMIKGNYTKNTIQHWQEAALLLGLAEYLKDNEEDLKVKKEITNYLNKNFDKSGQWLKKTEHIDVAILAYSIMKIDFIDTDNYKEALDYTWELIKEHIGEDGTVGYRKSMQNYRYVDTIGFICPFLVAYGNRYNKSECIDLAVKQIKEYVQYGMLEEHFIPCHAYKVDSKAPLGLYGWGRGLGWFAIGLIDTWLELEDKSHYKSDLQIIMKNFTKTVINLQQHNGSWNWTVTRNESRADSSTTATLGWFLYNASKIDGIAKESLDSSQRAISYLMKVTRRSGAIDFSQGDTKDIGVYSNLFNILPFTQGFVIRVTNSNELIDSNIVKTLKSNNAITFI